MNRTPHLMFAPRRSSKPASAAPRALLCSLLLGILPGVLPAQTIRGTVRDGASGTALSGATILLANARDSVLAVTLTGEDGSFRLRSSAGDTVRVRAERVGYRPMASGLVALAAGAMLELDVQLTPSPVTLQEITVTARRQADNRAEFEHRRRSEVWGRFADERILERVRSPRAVDRLRPLIPGMVVGPDGVIRVRKRGADLTGIPTCQPRLYIDGVRYPGDVSLDTLVPGDLIRAAEYYSEPQFAPGQFSMGFDAMIVTGPTLDGDMSSEPGLSRPCAIIVIWTIVGFGSDDG